MWSQWVKASAQSLANAARPDVDNHNHSNNDNEIVIHPHNRHSPQYHPSHDNDYDTTQPPPPQEYHQNEDDADIDIEEEEEEEVEEEEDHEEEDDVEEEEEEDPMIPSFSQAVSSLLGVGSSLITMTTATTTTTPKRTIHQDQEHQGGGQTLTETRINTELKEEKEADSPLSSHHVHPPPPPPPPLHTYFWNNKVPTSTSTYEEPPNEDPLLSMRLEDQDEDVPAWDSNDLDDLDDLDLSPTRCEADAKEEEEVNNKDAAVLFVKEEAEEDSNSSLSPLLIAPRTPPASAKEFVTAATTTTSFFSQHTAAAERMRVAKKKDDESAAELREKEEWSHLNDNQEEEAFRENLTPQTAHRHIAMPMRIVDYTPPVTPHPQHQHQSEDGAPDNERVLPPPSCLLFEQPEEKNDAPISSVLSLASSSSLSVKAMAPSSMASVDSSTVHDYPHYSIQEEEEDHEKDANHAHPSVRASSDGIEAEEDMDHSVGINDNYPINNNVNNNKKNQHHHPPVVDHTPDDDDQAEAFTSQAASSTYENSMNHNHNNPSSVQVVMTQEGSYSRDTGHHDQDEVDDVDDDAISDDENECNYGPVVDVTPTDATEAPDSAAAAQLFSVSGTNSTVVSMAVQAEELYQDLQRDDAMDDTVTCGAGDDADTVTKDGWDEDYDDENGIVHADGIDDRENNRRAPQESFYRDHEQQIDMVDHLPSEMDSSSVIKPVYDPSVDVQHSTSTKDSDSAGGDMQYGPVVDHTPATPIHSNAIRSSDATRSDTVVALVPDTDTVDVTSADYDDDVADDEEQDDEDKRVHLDKDMSIPVRSPDDLLVDFIPNHTQSRFENGSTMVAADFSEALSEGDDMAHEEGYFGPVVDLTPLNRPIIALARSPSATESSVNANSMAVFGAQSVVVDDLEVADGDGDDEIATRFADHNEWGTQDLGPNPQSGNDEPETPVNEQLVDFLPPENEQVDVDQDISVDGQLVSSEATVGGAQSLLHALVMDPVEDDFGPVVDLTPIPRPSDLMPLSSHSVASTSAQVSASECLALEKEDITDGAATEDLENSNEVIDGTPESQIRFPVHLTGSVLDSQLAEDEEEDEFGPVVDHLPTPRASASLAPSRGGSTVDALATVSEVDTDDDDDDVDGGGTWDDEIDVSEGGLSDRSALQKAAATSLAFRRTNDQERSMSVRFEVSVDDGKNATYHSNRLDHAQYVDPEIGMSYNGETCQYFNPSLNGEVNAWNDEDINSTDSPLPDFELSTKAFAEADTPPSTPYLKSDTLQLQPNSILLPAEVVPKDHNDSALSLGNNLEASYCTHDPLSEVLDGSNGEELKHTIGTLLQNEITKRMLVEKEAEALRETVKVHQLTCSLSEEKATGMDALIASLQNDNVSLHQNVDQLRIDFDLCNNERHELKENLDRTQHLLTDAVNTSGELKKSEALLKDQVKQLTTSLESTNDRLVSDNTAKSMLASLQSNFTSKSSECENLLNEYSQLQGRLLESESQLEKYRQRFQALTAQADESNFEQQHQMDELLIQLEDAKCQLTNAMEIKSKIITDLQSEKESLAIANEELQTCLMSRQVQHEEELLRQYALIDQKNEEIQAHEAAAHLSEKQRSILEADMMHQLALVEQSESIASKLQSVAKERDLLEKAMIERGEALASLQQIIDEHGVERQSFESIREAEVNHLKSELSDQIAEAQAKEMEMSRLAIELKSVSNDREEISRALREEQLICQSLEIKATRSQTELQEEQVRSSLLIEQVNTLRSQLAMLTSEAQQVDDDRKKSLAHLAALGRQLDRSEAESKLHAVRAVELEKRCRNAEVNFGKDIEMAKRQLHEESQRFTTEIQVMVTEKAELEKQLADSRLSRDSIAVERDAVASKCSEIEHLLSQSQTKLQEEIRNQTQTHNEIINDMSARFKQMEKQLSEERKMTEIMKEERNDLLTKCREHEMQLFEAENIHETRLQEILEENSRLAQQLRELSSLKQESDSTVELRRLVNELTSERSAFVEENEELLVQLGLFKQQLDDSNDRNRILQERVLAQEELSSRVDELNDENKTLTIEIDLLSSTAERLLKEKCELERLNQALHENEHHVANDLVDKQHSEDQILKLQHELDLRNKAATLLNEKLRNIQKQHLTQSTSPSSLGALPTSSLREDPLMERSQVRVIDELNSHLSKLNHELQSTRLNMTAKEAEIDSLKQEISQYQSKTIIFDSSSSQPPTPLSVASSTWSENSAAINNHNSENEVQNLRNHIVSLAMALEKSETKRGEAISRLLDERESNARFLKQLSDSVKRFYVSIADFGVRNSDSTNAANIPK